MKKALILICAVTAGAAIAKDTYVKPHVTKDGTFVDGHYKSGPNSTKIDNYSSNGNTNPYTGEKGTKDPYAPPKPSNGDSSRRW